MFATFSSFSFLLAYGAMEHRDLELGLGNAFANMPVLVSQGWKFWPFAICLNMLFVPVIYRTLLINVLIVFWNLYLVKTKG